MDPVSFVYGFGALQGVVLATILLLIKSGHRTANIIMSTLVIVIALRVLQKLLVHVNYWAEAPGLALTLYPTVFAWGPLLFLYALTLVGGELRLRHSWHFLPMVAYFLALNMGYWELTRLQQTDLVNYIWSNRADSATAAELSVLFPTTWTPFVEFHLHSLFFTIQLAVYCVWVLKLIQQHNSRLLRHYSSVDQMNLRWLRSLVYAVLAFLGLLLIFYLIPAIAYDTVDFGSAQANVQNLFLVAVIYGIGIAALFQPTIFRGANLDHANPAQATLLETSTISSTSSASQSNDEKRPIEECDQNEKYQRSGMSMEDAQRFHVCLMDIMQKEQLYLKNDLTLTDLADAAGLSTHQVSQVINSQMNHNFFSFVNNYRIQYAKTLLAASETKNMPIVELAFEVGFQSKSAFYEAFKRVTEMTPTQFKKSVSN
ncbi:MAG: helix-turn-helix transcriptional regulator [Pseudomonadota bacterium]